MAQSSAVCGAHAGAVRARQSRLVWVAQAGAGRLICGAAVAIWWGTGGTRFLAVGEASWTSVWGSINRAAVCDGEGGGAATLARESGSGISRGFSCTI